MQQADTTDKHKFGDINLVCVIEKQDVTRTVVFVHCYMLPFTLL